MKREKQNRKACTSKSSGKSQRKKGAFEGWGIGLLPEGTLAEMWWQGTSLQNKCLASRLAQMMAQLKPGLRIEIRAREGEIQARFTHVLEEREPGYSRGIIIPEG